jgi:hypothetical protein
MGHVVLVGPKVQNFLTAHLFTIEKTLFMQKIIHTHRKDFKRQKFRNRKSSIFANITYYHYAKSCRKAAGSSSILETCAFAGLHKLLALPPETQS